MVEPSTALRVISFRMIQVFEDLEADQYLLVREVGVT